jgi:hypothetical protein
MDLFFGTQRLINLVKSTPLHPILLISILMLSLHLCPSLRYCLSPSCFSTKIVCTFIFKIYWPTAVIPSLYAN